MTVTDERARRYVARLSGELGAFGDDQRRTIIEGVEEHILDSVDAGRGVDDVLAGLGDPRSAAEAYAAELGLPVGPDLWRRSRAVLGFAGAVIAAVSAAASVLVVSSVAGRTAGEIAWMVAVLVLPIALMLAPVAAARRSGGRRLADGLAIAAAVVLLAVPFAWLFTAFEGTAVDDVALLLFPTGFAACAAAIVPPATRWRKGARLALRIAGGAIALFPGALMLVASFSLTVESNAGLLVWALVGIGLSALYAWGSRWAYLIVAALGLGVMIAGVTGGGMLFLAFLVVGSLWLTLGVAGLAVRPYGRRKRV